LPHHRQERPAVRFGIAAALMLIAAAPARAQTTASPTDATTAATAAATAATAAERLLSPLIDGDPLAQPSFRKPPFGRKWWDRTTVDAPAPSRFNGLPIFGPQPGAGAGTTGFDSLNRPRGKRATRKTGRQIGVAPTGSRAVSDTDVLGADALRTTPSGRAATRTTRVYSQRPTTAPQPINGPAQRPSLTSRPRRAPAAASRTGAYGSTQTAANPDITGAIAPPHHRRPVEEDPFAPAGVRLGSFLFKPAVELSGGYDSNPAHSGTGKGSSLYIVAPELQAQSLWSRHELTANIKGSYTGYGETPTFNRPNLDAKVNGRIDVTRFTRVDLEGRTALSTDNPGSPNLPTSVASLPINLTYGATVGLRQQFNRFELNPKGMVDRAIYGNATLNNGSIVNNRDRNYVQYTGSLRGSYELTPGVKPFAEVGLDTRVHDLAVDNGGYARDSDGQYVKLGSTFELTRKLTGEASLGYLTRRYQDARLSPLHGLIGDASLVWTASGLTTVKFTAKSTADESTLAGVSGVLTRELGVEVEHAFRRWLIGTAKFTYGLDDYDGITRLDKRYQASLLLTYKATRSLWFKGEFRQDWLRSNAPGNDYAASTVLFGLRLQR
jgi:hypothetical protein